jgi:hypothetical protein
MPEYPYPIKVIDTRPEGHQSLNTLPRLGENDLDRLQEFYKFELLFNYGYEQAELGQLFWGIVAFELKAGPAILQPQVRDQNGQLITTPPGVLLFLHWPGTDPFPSPVDPSYAATGVAGFTEDKGSIGWAYGPDSHIGPEGGPFLTWASSDPADWPPETRRVGSDAVDKLGWWDDHIIPNPIFQVMKKTSSTAPPPTGTEYLVNVDASGAVTGHIPFIPGPPLAGSASLALMRDGKVVAHVEWGQAKFA